MLVWLCIWSEVQIVCIWSRWCHTHTYRLTALCPGLPGWAGTRKVKPITPPFSFYKPDALPAAQPTASKHWRQMMPLHPQTLLSLASFESRVVLLFWYQLMQVVLEKRLLNGCSSITTDHSILEQQKMLSQNCLFLIIFQLYPSVYHYTVCTCILYCSSCCFCMYILYCSQSSLMATTDR